MFKVGPHVQIRTQYFRFDTISDCSRGSWCFKGCKIGLENLQDNNSNDMHELKYEIS
jgi:hypothetical protein